MTKLLRVPILLDEPTAEAVREHTAPRRGPRAPAGEGEALRPGNAAGGDGTDPARPAADERRGADRRGPRGLRAALDAFLAGDWNEAYGLLHRVPPDDRGKDVLTEFILKNNRTPPPGWDGVIPLASKEPDHFRFPVSPPAAARPA